MILSLIVIFLLLAALGHGWRRGFVVQLARTLGYLVVFILAKVLTPVIAPMIANWLPANHEPSANTQLLSGQVNHFWASGITFWVLILIGGLVLHLLTRSLSFFTKLPVVHGINALAGALLSGLLMYLVIFFALAIGSVWPAEWMHEQLMNSPVSQWILNQTPVLSQQIYQWWLTRN